MSSETSQTQKDKYHMFSLIWGNLKKDDLKEEEGLLGTGKGEGKGRTDSRRMDVHGLGL